MCTKGIDQWLSVNWYPRLTLDQNLINARSAHQLTLERHVIDILVECQLTIFHWCANQYRVLIRCWSRSWPSVHWVSIEMLIQCWRRYWSSVDWRTIMGIDWHLTADTFRTHDAVVLGSLEYPVSERKTILCWHPVTSVNTEV